MKPWIAKKVFDTLGFEDEVVVEFVYSMLEQEVIDPKEMQINLTGFLEHKAAGFMAELWQILLSAQRGTDGIPEEFIEAKKQELLRKMEQEDLIAKQLKEQQMRLSEQNLKNRVKDSIKVFHTPIFSFFF
ncbi:Serine/arginine repetitive matrix protein 1 [Smittium mucronatum]|uniref:Serine/arginine repetitive matrix protein 1 n=1 Tax=Smittium mucronatum TaxID=133383 RepID=A0A1R0H1R7_9FUNG|nr:Serine/arginine repetitive matrix protein 1 [Smittium mucronatum]